MTDGPEKAVGPRGTPCPVGRRNHVPQRSRPGGRKLPFVPLASDAAAVSCPCGLPFPAPSVPHPRSGRAELQVNLLSKFLLIAKSCYEQRNFATAMQILGGLEHLAVRQSSVSPPDGPRPPRADPVLLGTGTATPGGSPVLSFQAWRTLPAKMAEVMEELKAVEVFLKSDSLCLMEGRRSRAQPTLPSARLLAMHIQQLETGGFTMTNGAHRWSKLSRPEDHAPFHAPNSPLPDSAWEDPGSPPGRPENHAPPPSAPPSLNAALLQTLGHLGDIVAILGPLRDQLLTLNQHVEQLRGSFDQTVSLAVGFILGSAAAERGILADPRE
ncbi:Protein very KIND [Pteropus alecto]|uniref:Protein very KIND n=1 Tax=Pteropus alecto TaxID=9402 RepID=L5KJE6_PTEAL|nr:Protein very KIND [Pteropus alecto]